MGKGSKKKRKGKMVGRPTATIKKMKVPEANLTESVLPTAPTPLTGPAEISSTPFESHITESAAQNKEKNSGIAKHLSGYIFMCNQSTKLECYQYRVFGLPVGKKEVVDEIKPGAKLFLYDFESKLLYGIYEADSHGMLNLEPSAFKGKFPAQVKFKIFKECLPLPESFLKKVLKENYTGSKFKQELSRKHVRKLLSAFRPLTVSSSASTSQAHTSARSWSSNILPTVEHHPIPRPYVSHSHQLYPRSSMLMEHRSPTLDHRRLTAATNYDVGNAHWPSYTRDVALRVQGTFHPGSTSTHMMAHHHQVSSWHTGITDERARHAQPTNVERHYHPSPLNREALYQDNTTAACNTNLTANLRAASVSHHQVPISYHHPPLHMGQQYDNYIPAYDPAVPSLFTASSQQQQVPANFSQTPSQSQQQHVPANFSQTPSQHQDNVAAYYNYYPT